MDRSYSDNDVSEVHQEYQLLDFNKVDNYRDSASLLAKQQDMIEKYKKDNEVTNYCKNSN